jgi:hypothetical protein
MVDLTDGTLSRKQRRGTHHIATCYDSETCQPEGRDELHRFFEARGVPEVFWNFLPAEISTEGPTYQHTALRSTHKCKLEKKVNENHDDDHDHRHVNHERKS